MNTVEKTTRAAGIIVHLNAIIENRTRPSIPAMDDLAQASAELLLAELESMFEDLYPDNAACRAVLGDFRASLY